MKNLVLLFSLLLVVSTAFSQSKPQKKIRDAFEQHQPEAKEVKWTGEGDRYKVWTADYMVGADSLRTKYDAKANWLFTFKSIKLEQLPEKVTSSILSEYQGCKLTQGGIMQEPDFDGYGVVFMYKKDRWAVAITSEGDVARRKMTSKGFDF